MIAIDFAPMEGITGFAFRNAHHRHYGGISRYYTPFLNVQADSCFSRSDMRDVLFENNKDLLEDRTCALVPQLLTGYSETLLLGIRTLADMGYREINWNLGCPSPTVTRRGRGAGLLAEPEKIDRILDETFSALEKENADVRLSVKMRTGMNSADFFPYLVSILNRYPLSEIILHPRYAAQGYQGSVDEDIFAQALSASRCPVSWNGDIKSLEDVKRIRNQFPKVERIMIGRGLVTEPALAEEILRGLSEDGKQKNPPTDEAQTAPLAQALPKSEPDRFRVFHDEILEGYLSYIPDEKGALARMKELWGWWEKNALFADSAIPAETLSRTMKKIKKAKSVSEYKAEVCRILDSLAG